MILYLLLPLKLQQIQCFHYLCIQFFFSAILYSLLLRYAVFKVHFEVSLLAESLPLPRFGFLLFTFLSPERNVTGGLKWTRTTDLALIRRAL